MFFSCFAERKGFEPSMQLPAYYLSRVAPSTTRTPFYYSRKDKKNIQNYSVISPLKFLEKFSAKVSV